MDSQRKAELKAMGVGLAMGVTLALSAWGIAEAQQSRPNSVVVISPAGTQGWNCGNVQHPDPHQWVFRDCRRRAGG